MSYPTKRLLLVFLASSFSFAVIAQNLSLLERAEVAMIRASTYMDKNVSTQGGYVWFYLPDLSRRWGEMEAYSSMIWVQDGGTVSVGHMLLDAYQATRNEYYYQLVEKAAQVMMLGQSNEGGWNYMIDLAGETSLKKWYATIGKNGWRLEEFQHYYGNDTYDDDVTSDAARFLLRVYLEKQDPKVKQALDKAIAFVLRSQYANGGWPQRYPHKDDFSKNGHADYTGYHTFNDDVIWENVLFLIQCYEALGEERFLAPINKGMDFYVKVQGKNGAWGQQYDAQLKVAGARTYEPAAYLPSYTFNNCLLLLKFYKYTGDRKFLAPIPAAIQWLKKVKLPLAQTENGKYTHPLFIDTATDKPIYVHRKGTNVHNGQYYTDESDKKLLAHMYGKRRLDITFLEASYHKTMALDPEQVTKDSPLKNKRPRLSFDRYDTLDLHRAPSEADVQRILDAMDVKGRWLVKNVMISHPYKGDGKGISISEDYATTHVGDETDTSPFRDTSDQQYISTPEYIRNMQVLIDYIRSRKTIWSLDRLEQIGGYVPEQWGSPTLQTIGKGKVVHFDGIDDGLVFPVIPVEGCNAFAIEVWVKPSADGPVAPRILHFEDSLMNRGTIELRLTKEGKWYADVFLKNGKLNKGVTLIDSTRLHEADRWSRIALVYDGKKMSSCVNGRKELEADMEFPPVTKGRLSLGVRLNKMNWFKGQVGRVVFYKGYVPDLERKD